MHAYGTSAYASRQRYLLDAGEDDDEAECKQARKMAKWQRLARERRGEEPDVWESLASIAWHAGVLLLLTFVMWVNPQRLQIFSAN